MFDDRFHQIGNCFNLPFAAGRGEGRQSCLPSARRKPKIDLMKKLIVLMALAACTEMHTPKPQPIGDSLSVGTQDTCGAQRYHTLRGQDASVLERILIMGQVRVIRHGMMVTQDYRPDRMNININASGRIDRISCG